MPQYLASSSPQDIRYIRIEKVILEYLDLVFSKYEVSDANYICVTRNADIAPDDEALEVSDDCRRTQIFHKPCLLRKPVDRNLDGHDIRIHRSLLDHLKGVRWRWSGWRSRRSLKI